MKITMAPCLLGITLALGLMQAEGQIVQQAGQSTSSTGTILERLYRTRPNAEELERLRPELIRSADSVLPLLLTCLSKSGYPVAGSGHPRDHKTQVERNRLSAVFGVHLLGDRASSIVPQLASMLGNRNWPGRHETVLALSEIGPSASNVLATALEQVKSDSKALRVQAVILLYGVGRQSSDAVNAVIEASHSHDEDVWGHAVYGLGKLREASIPARLRLEEIANDKQESHSHSFKAQMALGLDPAAKQSGGRASK
jgi:hypothetical protein